MTGGAQIIPRPPHHAPGRPAPWAGLTPGAVPLDRVAEALASRGPGRPTLAMPVDARPSAVLAALFDDGGEAHVLLTRRAGHLANHPGQVSFPGGRQEPGERPLDTALREAHEEVALDPSLPRPLGELDHLYTVVSRSYIVPVVAALPGRPTGLHPNAAEVDRVFTVPLGELLVDGVYREERWGPTPVERPVWFFELEGETIWGATAAMLRQLLCITLGLER